MFSNRFHFIETVYIIYILREPDCSSSLACMEHLLIGHTEPRVEQAVQLAQGHAHACTRIGEWEESGGKMFFVFP